jgi:FtsZ-binding cell division protein ZapB
MDLKIISDLENKIGRAVDMIADLKNETVRQEKENQKLRHQFDEYRKEFEKSEDRVSRPGFDSRKIKERLEKLAGKLAALEDSWS